MENTLGNRISILRRQKELKQEALAEMLGVSPQAVSKWENDQTCPDITLLPKLAKILGATVDELLTGESAPALPAVRMLSETERKDMKDLTLRIVADTSDGTKARVNLPMELIRVALETGMAVPQVSGSAFKEIDFNQLFQLVSKGVVGNLVEAETSDGCKVSVFVE